MNGDNGNDCKVCGAALVSEREQHMLVCFECRRYGLLNGSWPAHELPKPADAVAVRSVEIHLE